MKTEKNIETIALKIDGLKAQLREVKRAEREQKKREAAKVREKNIRTIVVAAEHSGLLACSLNSETLAGEFGRIVDRVQNQDKTYSEVKNDEQTQTIDSPTE